MGGAERNVDNFAKRGGDGPGPVRAKGAMGNVAQKENALPARQNRLNKMRDLRNRIDGSLPGKDARGMRSRPSRSAWSDESA